MVTQDSISGHLLLQLVMLMDSRTLNICALVHELVHHELLLLHLSEGITFVTQVTTLIGISMVISLVMIHSGMEQDVDELTHAAPSTLHHGSRINSLAQLLIP